RARQAAPARTARPAATGPSPVPADRPDRTPAGRAAVRPLAVRPLAVRPLAVRPLAVRPLAVRRTVTPPVWTGATSVPAWREATSGTFPAQRAATSAATSAAHPATS